MGRSTEKSWSSAPKAASVKKRRGKAASVAADYEASDSDVEEEDAFEKRRDKISISGGRGSKAADSEEDDLDDEEVMGLSDDDDDDEDEDEDEEDEDGSIDYDDEDALIEAALGRGGKSAERGWCIPSMQTRANMLQACLI